MSAATGILGRRIPIALLVISLAGVAALSLLQRMPMSDLIVYRAEGFAVLKGTDLYGFRVTQYDLPATYPPFAALLFVPAALLPLPVTKAVFVLGNVLLLALLVLLSLRLAGVRTRTATGGAVALIALAVWFEPVSQTWLFGQINLALACLVLWDFGRPDDAPGKGFAIGVAAGVKLTPAIFAVHLLLTGRVRAGLTALGGFAITVLVGGLALPGASVDFWTRRLYETARVGKVWIVDNQSLQGLLARLLHTPEPGHAWLAAAAVAGVAGLLLARSAARRGLEAWGVLCTAVTALLVSPISWSHHWVWCVPLLVLLAAEARGAAARTAVAALTVLFTARSMWLVPREGDLDLRLPWWQQPLASPYPLLGLAFLGLVAWRLRHVGPDDGPLRPGFPRRVVYVPSPASRSSASTIR